MSKKNKILLIVGGALVLVLALLYAFVFSKMGDDEEKKGTNTPTVKTELVFENASEDTVERLTVSKNGAVLYSIYYDSLTDGLLLEGLEANPYNDTFTSVVSSLSTLSVSSRLDDPLSPENYGLDGTNSPYTVEYSDRNGNRKTLYIGDKTVADDGYYAQEAENNAIFTVSERIEKLFCEKNALLSTVLATPLDNTRYYYTESFTLYKDLYPFVGIEFVPEEEQTAWDIYGSYRMTYPASYTPSDVNYDTVLRSLISPSADSIVTTEITDENLEFYGFTRPSYELEYTLDGKTRHIYFGKSTGDGLIYVLSSEFAFIGIVSLEKSFPFLNWELVNFINPALFGMNIDHVSRIIVSTDDGEESYRLDGLGSDLIVTAEIAEKTVDTYNFRQFYRVLLMASMEGYADSTATDDWTLAFTIETRDGIQTRYDFYRQTTRKCFYTVDGKGEFYVSVDVVNKILSDAKKLQSGESINADSQL